LLKCFFILFITNLCTAKDCETHFVTHQELQQIMGTSQSLSKFVQPLNKMLKDNDLDCPLRIAAFLAQVRYETDGLKIFLDTDGAGAFHMIPSDIRIACYELPEVKATFAQTYKNCTQDSPCDCGQDNEIVHVLQDPKYAFETAAWLFIRGATAIRGSKCSNLTGAADEGLGNSAGEVMSGFHHITRCLHGYDNTEALDQRIEFYNDALAIVNSWNTETLSQNSDNKPLSLNSDNNKELTTKSYVLSFWQVIGIGIGFLVALIVIVVLIAVAASKRSKSERV